MIGELFMYRNDFLLVSHRISLEARAMFGLRRPRQDRNAKRTEQELSLPVF